MEYQAVAKYIRTSPRKLRLVADAVRGLPPEIAIVHLGEMGKRAGTPLAEVIKSAIANARQKQADEMRLRFKRIEVTEGPVMKRWRAVSRGRAHGYKRRMSHVRIVLTDTEKKEEKSTKEGDNGTEN